jgi:hypothetical protein
MFEKKDIVFFSLLSPKSRWVFDASVGRKERGVGREGGRREAGERERESSSSVCNQVMRMRM